MNKSASLALALTLCALLLSGCGFHIMPFPGLSAFHYEYPEKYSVGGAAFTDRVEKVEIHWLSGSVTVTGHKGNEVRFSEKANRNLTNDLSMHYWLEGSTLRIQFCRSGKWNLNGLEKDLTLQLPERLLESLEVDTVSARISLEGLAAEELELDTVSGAVRLRDCQVTDRARVDTTSGSVKAALTGALREWKADTVSGSVELTIPEVRDFDVNTTSGSVSLTAERAPKDLNVDSVSGSVSLCLPADGDFTLDFDTVSGSFSSELACKTEGSRCVFGKGNGDYSIDTTSGSVYIEKK
ncbi:MAG: DUF4097 family beta strand repeat-containing protein [Candidatus Limivicinus sp.]